MVMRLLLHVYICLVRVTPSRIKHLAIDGQAKETHTKKLKIL